MSNERIDSWSEINFNFAIEDYKGKISVQTYQIGITGQTGTNWDTEMVSIWSLIPVSA